ncbi:hypothetical protein UK12_34150, partial [Saccharothrix sp. ST-888]
MVYTDPRCAVIRPLYNSGYRPGTQNMRPALTAALRVSTLFAHPRSHTRSAIRPRMLARASYRCWFWLGLPASVVVSIGVVSWLITQCLNSVSGLCPSGTLSSSTI